MEQSVAELKAKGVDSIGILADVLVARDIDRVMETVKKTYIDLTKSQKILGFKAKTPIREGISRMIIIPEESHNR